MAPKTNESTGGQHFPATRFPATRFSAAAITRVISSWQVAVKSLPGGAKTQMRQYWLRAIASLTTAKRPDLAPDLVELLGVEPLENGENPLANLTIGEIAVCYEALLAQMDAPKRRHSGQFFTPDDAATFMGAKTRDFPDGTWLDPCCGIGNLAWHLVASQADPARFLRSRVMLVDSDATALLSAVALLGAKFLPLGDHEGLAALQARACNRDFLSKTKLAPYDFVIANPPYARAKLRPGLETGASRELFAYFMEHIATRARGFVAVTPASYLCAPKFAALRRILERENSGGRVFVFDNVPDTLFRGYKFGSSNTSNTNFVRAAITVCNPANPGWLITPILRWKSANRARMFALADSLLAPRELGAAGEWVKLPASLHSLWRQLSRVTLTLRDLLAERETPYALTVATTPRYYISASYRNLERSSKVSLYFPDAATRDRAAVVLNSSLPYFWWRALDGGVTLPRRVLLSTPIPLSDSLNSAARQAARELEAAEAFHLVAKLNAGKVNENVKRPPELVKQLDAIVFASVAAKTPDFTLLYSKDMTALGEAWAKP